MNPPVDAPTSTQSRPVTRRRGRRAHCCSFSPPRETNRAGRSTSSTRSSSTCSPGLCVPERGRRVPRLGLGPALRQPPFHEEDVEPLLRHSARLAAAENVRAGDPRGFPPLHRGEVRPRRGARRRAASPVGAREADDLDAPAGLGCVHLPSTPEVQANVPEALEEEDVSRLHASLAHPPALAVERVGVVRGRSPTRPYAQRTRPEQSKPVEGDSPPQRYGMLTASTAKKTARSAVVGGSGVRSLVTIEVAGVPSPGAAVPGNARTATSETARSEQGHAAAEGGRHREEERRSAHAR